MKKSVLVTVLTLFVFSSQSQTKDSVIIFNEFSISISHPTNELSTTPKLQVGFGLGAKRRLFTQKKNNFIIGLEYNFDKYYYSELKEVEDKYKTYSNVYIKSHKLTVPFSYRLCIGQKIKAFIEPGLFAEYILYSNFQAQLNSYTPFETNPTKQVSTNGDQGQLKVGAFLCTGLLIPYKKNHLLVKLELKAGKQSHLRLSLGINI